MEIQNSLLESLDERIKAVARELIQAELRSLAAEQPPVITTHEHAESIRAELARINAKEFISAREAATLLSCSTRHVHNLVDRARRGGQTHPIPYRKVGDSTVFRRADLLAWTERRPEGREGHSDF